MYTGGILGRLQVAAGQNSYLKSSVMGAFRVVIPRTHTHDT